MRRSGLAEIVPDNGRDFILIAERHRFDNAFFRHRGMVADDAFEIKPEGFDHSMNAERRLFSQQNDIRGVVDISGNINALQVHQALVVQRSRIVEILYFP